MRSTATIQRAVAEEARATSGWIQIAEFRERVIARIEDGRFRARVTPNSFGAFMRCVDYEIDGSDKTRRRIRFL